MRDTGNIPPKSATWVLNHCLPRKDREFLVGDCESIFFDQLENKGRSAARAWYWRQCLKTTFPFLIHRLYWRLDMFKNYLTICFRQIRKHTVYSFINVFGLALGLAACLLIYMWVQDELSFDRFHEKRDHVFRVIQETHTGDQIAARPGVSSLLAPALKEELPEIKSTITGTMIPGFWPVKIEGESIENVHIAMTSPDFFTTFDFSIIKGDRSAVLSENTNLVVSRSLAERLFGPDDPVGRSIEINRREFQVTGVFDNVPQNSHVQFDCVIPVSMLADHPAFARWTYTGFALYLELAPEVELENLNQRMTQILKKHHPEFEGRLYLQPLKRIHLYSKHFQYDYAVLGEYRYVLIFSVLAVFLLLIAGINFMNLSTARAAGRAKEVGMRKVMGANRLMMVRQFFTESILLSIVALFLALIAVYLLLPILNQLTGKQLSLHGLAFLRLLGNALVFTILIGVLSGIYPAIVLSSFKPTRVLKRDVQPGKSKSTFRRTLVVFQFSLSILLIIATAVIHRQLEYARTSDLGYNRENIIVLGVEGDFYSNFETQKQELLKHPNVLNVARGFQPIWNRIQTAVPTWAGQEAGKELAMQCYGAGYDYFQTWGMEIVKGRPFSKSFSTDTSNYVINETAARAMGFDSPLGQQITVDGVTGQIIGVVKDFHHTSFHNVIQPIVFRIYGAAGFAIKLRAMDQGALDYIASVWEKAVPESPFELDPFAVKVDAFYENEDNLARLFNGFTFLATFISCLGLLGLSSYIAESRTKEIGIRKVLGASVSNLVIGLSKEFVLLVVLANAIAWPIAWWTMTRWLENFAYRFDMSIWLFFGAAVMAVVIALLTVSFQAMKAASADPVKTLRYE